LSPFSTYTVYLLQTHINCWLCSILMFITEITICRWIIYLYIYQYSYLVPLKGIGIKSSSFLD